MSPSAGRSRPMSCSPACVGATLRVVRASRRTPNRSSNPRIAWLTAEVDTPRRFAARVKLRSSATVRNADRRSEEHTSELQSRFDLVCRLLLEKTKHAVHLAAMLRHHRSRLSAELDYSLS